MKDTQRSISISVSVSLSLSLSLSLCLPLIVFPLVPTLWISAYEKR
jgi:hypothetical protein